MLRGLARELEPECLDVVLGAARAELSWLPPEFGPCEAPPPESGIGQARLFEQLFGVFARLASIRPLVLVVEDIHWADRSTRDLLRFLVRNLQTEPVALIATYRADDVHRGHPLRPILAELERESKVRRIALAPFARADFADHVGSLMGHTPDPSFLDQLYARSEGNAFYTEELVAAGEDTFPASLREALVVRLERLSELAQQVVRAAAVAGHGCGSRFRLRTARGANRRRSSPAAPIAHVVSKRYRLPTRRRALSERGRSWTRSRCSLVVHACR